MGLWNLFVSFIFSSTFFSISKEGAQNADSYIFVVLFYLNKVSKI